MKVLCIIFSPVTGSLGSLTRILALAREFSRHGHELLFCASGHTGQLIEKKNFTVLTMPEPTLFGLPPPVSRLLEKRMYGMHIPVRDGKEIGSLWFIYWLTGMLSRRYLPRLVKAQLGAIGEFKPDIIITEMDPGAHISARISGIPLVNIFAKISEHGKGNRCWRKSLRLTNRILTAHGLGTVPSPESLSDGNGGNDILDIIPSVPALDGSEETGSVIYVGNLLEPVQDGRTTFSAAPGKRYIFVYAGTGSIPLNVLRDVLPEAFRGLSGIDCLVAAESLQKEEKMENVFFARWIPAAEILPQCDLVICHGGLNTITQSLAYGVPVLAFPGPIFERRYNARMLMENGAGMMGESADFNAEWIRAQYERRADFAPGVRKLEKEFKRYSGTDKAVKRIIRWQESARGGSGEDRR